MVTGIYYLALNAFHEARGEPDKGVLFVCYTVLNRTRIRRLSIKEVVYEPYQFSWTLQKNKTPITSEPKAYKRCRAIALSAVDNYLNGRAVYNVDHYHRIDCDPSWDDEMKQLAIINDHVFFEGKAAAPCGRI